MFKSPLLGIQSKQYTPVVKHKKCHAISSFLCPAELDEVFVFGYPNIFEEGVFNRFHGPHPVRLLFLGNGQFASEQFLLCIDQLPVYLYQLVVNDASHVQQVSFADRDIQIDLFQLQLHLAQSPKGFRQSTIGFCLKEHQRFFQQPKTFPMPFQQFGPFRTEFGLNALADRSVRGVGRERTDSDVLSETHLLQQIIRKETHLPLCAPGGCVDDGLADQVHVSL